jgi:ABC-type Mn2+/Zn2+ transport system permease subunit
MGDIHSLLPQIIIGTLLSVALNFAAPIIAYLFSRRLKRYRWWPHAIACLWVISSVGIFEALVMPQLPPDEIPSFGEQVTVAPTLLSAALIFLGYCVAVLWQFLRFMFREITMAHAK